MGELIAGDRALPWIRQAAWAAILASLIDGKVPLNVFKLAFAALSTNLINIKDTGTYWGRVAGDLPSRVVGGATVIASE